MAHTVHFQDYTSEQLYNIAVKFAVEDGYYFHPAVREKLISIFDIVKRDPEFGNARYARNVIEKAESMKSDRIDIMAGFDEIVQTNNKVRLVLTKI